MLNGEALGKVLPQAADALKPFFAVTDDAVALDAADPSAALKEAFDALRAQDAIPMLRGWRDEPFAIRPSFAAPARAVVERAAAPLLGAPAYGVFCTAYVQDDSGAPAEVWLGRRSKSKPTWPGLLDSAAAGGLAAGELPRDAMAAECQEEAGVSEDLLHGLKPVGAVSYTGFHQDRDWAVKPDTLFCFDLAWPVGRQCQIKNRWVAWRTGRRRGRVLRENYRGRTDRPLGPGRRRLEAERGTGAHRLRAPRPRPGGRRRVPPPHPGAAERACVTLKIASFR